MYQFTNGYNCAIDMERKMVSIRFIQNIPSFNEKGELDDSEITEIASVVMSPDMAKTLGSALTSIMEEESASGEISSEE